MTGTIGISKEEKEKEYRIKESKQVYRACINSRRSYSRTQERK